MADIRPRLGRGLDALLAAEPLEGEKVVDLELDRIEPNPHQPRQIFAEDKLEELAASIREHGVVQPVLVRRYGDRYQIIAGERRWRAARLAGLTTVPVVVREMSDAQMIEIALIENIQRQDLNPMEEARAYQALMGVLGCTQEELAVRVGKSRAVIANALRLLHLDEAVQRMVEEGRLTAGHARCVAGLGSPTLQREAARRAAEAALTVRETEALVKRLQRQGETVAAKRAGAGAPRQGEDAVFRAIVRVLEEHLGARVRLNWRGDRGTVEIEFYSPQDLERLCETITGRPLNI